VTGVSHWAPAIGRVTGDLRPVWTAEAHIAAPTDFYTHPGVTVVYRIAKQFRFEAAHQLPGLPEGHQCGRLHGHSYTAEIWLAADVLTGPGFVADFADLAPVGAYLDGVADHRCLNDLIDSPTSERLAEHLYHWVVANVPLPPTCRVDKVRVSETAKSWAEYQPTAAVTR
jgi:6-pyruvoyltetrahydropterin/6-carboxytetrahydropterin synthase